MKWLDIRITLCHSSFDTEMKGLKVSNYISATLNEVKFDLVGLTAFLLGC